MTAVLPFVLLFASSAVGYHLARPTRVRSRRWFGGLLILGLGALPWLAPAEPVLRFFVGLGVILTTARTLETLFGHVPHWARQSFVAYARYYLSVVELYETERQDQPRARRAGGLRLVRAMGKCVLLVGCFALATAFPSLHAFWPLHSLWCLYAAYFAASGAADLSGGLSIWLSGQSGSEIFDSPHLATSPRDFWSRRWNSMFRTSAHRLVFTPLGGAQHPVRSVLGVFAVSAVVHEYLVVASLGASAGHMALFFTLHGVATLLTGMRRTPWPVPRGADVVLHSAWLVVTAPVFFAPLERIFPVTEWRLW